MPGITDIIAIYAAVVATGVLLWDFYKWRRTERVRLSGRVMRNAIIVGGFSSATTEAKYISLTIDNRGRIGCTITHFVVIHYKNWLNWLRGKSDFEGIVNTHGGQGDDVPYELRPGGKSFTGIASQTREIEELSRTGRLYIGISHTLESKPFLVRVKPIQDDVDKMKIKKDSPDEPRSRPSARISRG
jgi:hypothetical protein